MYTLTLIIHFLNLDNIVTKLQKVYFCLNVLFIGGNKLILFPQINCLPKQKNKTKQNKKNQDSPPDWSE